MSPDNALIAVQLGPLKDRGHFASLPHREVPQPTHANTPRYCQCRRADNVQPIIMVDVRITWTLCIGEVRNLAYQGGVSFLGLWFVKMFTHFLPSS